ncbi:MAG: DUF2721 domain-containing protein [Pseudomonadota bacterium]|nr:DUF2721 domain-containing protein [Pseudomonadota bacterium]
MPVDADIINNAIRLAVAPVFLLTAVAGLLGAIVGRLARIIDRARTLEDQLEEAPEGRGTRRAMRELAALRRRGQLTNASIALLTLCAFAIGLTIILLFLGEASSVRVGRSAMVSFLGGVGAFLLALLCFLIETFLATRILDFRALEEPRPPPAPREP